MGIGLRYVRKDALTFRRACLLALSSLSGPVSWPEYRLAVCSLSCHRLRIQTLGDEGLENKDDIRGRSLYYVDQILKVPQSQLSSDNVALRIVWLFIKEALLKLVGLIKHNFYIAMSWYFSKCIETFFPQASMKFISAIKSNWNRVVHGLACMLCAQGEKS